MHICIKDRSIPAIPAAYVMSTMPKGCALREVKYLEYLIKAFLRVVGQSSLSALPPNCLYSCQLDRYLVGKPLVVCVGSVPFMYLDHYQMMYLLFGVLRWGFRARHLYPSYVMLSMTKHLVKSRDLNRKEGNYSRLKPFF